MNYQSERALQELSIRELTNLGYLYMGSELDVKDLNQNFFLQVERLNKNKLPNGLNNNEKQRLLDSLPLTMRDAHNVLRHGLTLALDNNKTINISFFDKHDNSNNIYQVTEELNVQGVSKTRLDLVILINGIPVMNIELKRKGVTNGVDEAINQINRYNKTGVYRNGLLKFIQIFVVSNNVFTKYFAASPRAEQNEPYSKSFFWTDDKNKRIHDIDGFLQSFCNKEQLFKIIRDYMTMTPVSTSNDVFILRPYQIFAVENSKNIVLDTDENCFVWHATGSGKTLTSYTLGNSLAYSSKFSKVIMLLDRNDLADQTIEEYKSFNENLIDNVHKGRDLHKQMADPNQRFIMTTLQSFARWVQKYGRTVAKLKQGNYCFIIDECHRTTFGKMFKEIRLTFKNSQFIGFTGTPRLSENPSDTDFLTKDIFGEPAHIYTIKNAIDDGNVLPFSMHEVKIETGKEPEQYNRKYYASNERMVSIAAHIGNNLWKNTAQKNKIKLVDEGNVKGYTAMLACQGKQEAKQYWNMLKPLLTEQNRTVALVFSIEDNVEDKGDGNQHDWYLENLKHHDETFGTSFVSSWSVDRSRTVKEHVRDVTSRVKNKEIDLLIVSDMLLTGFDAQTLNTIYLDKNLEYHGLLQAMSRVNRTHSASGKQFGNVVIFSDRNMDTDVDDAITLFSNGGATDGVVSRRSFKEIYNETVNAVQLLKSKVDQPSNIADIDTAEDLIQVVKMFGNARKLIKTIQTYDEWESKDWAKLSITEDQMEEYYAHIYEQRKKFVSDNEGQNLILEELDFEITMVTEHIINVAYINNLLHNGIFAPKREREKWWKQARKAIDISDDPEVLRNKEALLKTVEAASNGEISSTEELFDKLDKTRHEIETLRFEEYAKVFGVTEDDLRLWVSVYANTNHVPRDLIQQNLNGQELGFLALNGKVEEIIKIIKTEFTA